MEIQTVKLSNGETMAYRERPGSGKTVLLIHGNMTSSKHWDVLMEALDEQYHLYAVDLRGFGGSSYHTRIKGIKDFSDDLKSFVDIMGITDCSLIGWSTGGAVGMQFAAEHPGFCQKLILIASASTRGYPFYGTKESGEPDLANRLKAIEEVERDTGKTIAVQLAYDQNNRDFLKAMWNMLIYTHNKPCEEHFEAYVDDMRTQRNLADVYQALNTFNISEHHNGLVEGNGKAKEITIPVLVLRGDRDYVVHSQMVKEILDDLGSNAQFKELKNCGHSPLIDDLGQLLQEVSEFLAN
ncbi:alpha/beta hydrolase [Falsibacillus albus]|uniref:Alpha/beta hydrolase n=2 Tax=Falsibacillus albus TaxID=2478915 RepID=A0A3L7K5J3_9BACI|nr:alpha/beta hydrolase [Falsibacillus albus]